MSFGFRPAIRPALGALLPCLALSFACGQRILDSLYAPDPPPNSAFVRVVNGMSSDVAATVGTQRVGARMRDASPYVIVPQGAVAFSAGKTAQTVKVQAGKFYTLALTGSAAAPT